MKYLSPFMLEFRVPTTASLVNKPSKIATVGGRSFSSKPMGQNTSVPPRRAEIQQPTRHGAEWAVSGVSNDFSRFVVLFEVARSSFAAVALIAGGDVFQLAFGKYRLHFDLPAAGAEELLCNHVDPSILANFCHNVSSSSFSMFSFNTGVSKAQFPTLTEWKSPCPP
jgi:hypothetical protein